MTKVLEDRDASLAWQSGWTHEYTIERDDGKQVVVAVDCDVDEADAEGELKAAIKDRGRAVAMKAAETPDAMDAERVRVRCNYDGIATSYE